MAKIFYFSYTKFLLIPLISFLVNGDTESPPRLLTDNLKEPEDLGDDTTQPPPSPPEPVSSGSAEIITGDAECSCGRPRIAGRIVGGELAKINELPWTAAIVNTDYGLVFCGGTLICDRYVATAAHCMEYVYSPNEIQVYLMEEDFDVANENAKPTLIIEVAEIIKHPEYNRKKINNDITRLKLATPVKVHQEDEESMTPACVPANNDYSFAGVEATVAGWGATDYGQSVVSRLRKVNVPIFDQEECRNKTKYRKVLTENMLCAGFLEGEKDACTGDSGGPLVVKQNGQFILAGIVSFGRECALAKGPGVHARVGRYGDWIREHTKDCQFCKE